MEDKEKEMSSKLQNLRAGLSTKRKCVSMKTNNFKIRRQNLKKQRPENPKGGIFMSGALQTLT